MSRLTSTALAFQLAASSCAHAQFMVKINAATAECDLNSPPAGAAVFETDSQGNVLMYGTLSGPGCIASDSSPTFSPLIPAPATLTVTPPSINAGDSAVLSYDAAFASSCEVTASSGTVSGTGTCPSVVIANASCTGSGTGLNCTPNNATVSEPISLPAGVNYCSYTLSATCNPGAVVSPASFTVTGVASNPCQDLSFLQLSPGIYWSKRGTAQVTDYNSSGNGTTSPGNVDVTDYAVTWDTAWPGTDGISVRVPMGVTFLSEAFTTDDIVDRTITWANNAAATEYHGANNAASYTISSCPRDFGQNGSQLGANCAVDIASVSGLVAKVSSVPQAGYCTLMPGTTYYLNVLPASLSTVATGTVAAPSCSSSCTPWTVVKITP